MKLTVVGCSGSMPGPEGPASCYLVEAEGFRMVLDLGNGALGPLARSTDIYGLDAVLLTHLHPDHCLDLCSYYVARTYGSEAARRARLPVYAPAGAPERMARAQDIAPDPGMTERFDFSAWTAGLTYALGPFEVTVDRVFHPVETYGLRLTHGGRVLTYSGDSDACPELVGLARDTDLFLCEASFAENGSGYESSAEPGVHLSGRGAGEQAALAGARRLLLTHIPPWNDPQRTLDGARTSYDGPVELARPAATYEV